MKEALRIYNIFLFYTVPNFYFFFACWKKIDNGLIWVILLWEDLACFLFLLCCLMHFCSSMHFKVVSVKVKQAIIRLLWGGERRLQSSLYPLLSPSETASHTKSDITSTGASHSLWCCFGWSGYLSIFVTGLSWPVEDTNVLSCQFLPPFQYQHRNSDFQIIQGEMLQQLERMRLSEEKPFPNHFGFYLDFFYLYPSTDGEVLSEGSV